MTSYTLYDNDGNLKTKVDANGTTATMTYDELDRMTLKSYAPGSSPPASYVATPAVAYTYDDASVPYSMGRLTAVSNGSLWQVWGFDQLGRPTVSAQTTNTTQYIFPSYAYNLADELLSETYPSGRKILTAYDAVGRIGKVSGAAPSNGPVTTYASLPTDPTNHVFAYAAHGAIQQMTLGMLTEQTCYNTLLQPAGIRLGSGTTGNCVNAARAVRMC